MASVNRTLGKAVEHYRLGVGSFVSAGIAPPVDFVSSGPVSIAEATPVLLSLHHEFFLERVKNLTGRELQKAARKVGAAAVNDAMRAELARIYRVSVSDLDEASAMYKRTDVHERDQPMANGDYDLDLLRAESEERLTNHASVAVPAFALSFATVGDPRLARRISMVGAAPGRLIWASMLRPHEVEELRYEDLRSIWFSSGQWRFDFIDWRRRAFIVEKRAEWDVLMGSVREESAKAGFGWDFDYEGKREGVR